MGWHTNNDSPGLRVYISHAQEDGKSSFTYWDGLRVIDDIDNEGFNVRVFDVNRDAPLWHCVKTKTNRISFGFKIL